MAKNDNEVPENEAQETTEEENANPRKVIEFEGNNWNAVNSYAKELMTDYHGFVNLMVLVYETLTPEDKAELIMSQAKKRVEQLLNNS